MTTRASKCSICFQPIGIDANGWDGGHNASPVKEGQCCENCNRTKVIPERMRNFGYSEDQIKEISEYSKRKEEISVNLPEQTINFGNKEI